MSNLYWHRLANEPTENSELLSEYKELSEKLNDYFQDTSFLESISLQNSISESPKRKISRSQKRVIIVPKHMEKRFEDRIERKGTLSGIERPTKKKHHKVSTMRLKSEYLVRNSYPNVDNFIIRASKNLE